MKDSPIPRLPEQYLDRMEERRTIEDRLDKQGARVAIYGLPGVGKTALAAKLAADAPAKLHVDRVLWADFGLVPDAVTVLRDWCLALDAEIAAVSGTPDEQLDYLRDRLSEAVGGRLVLFVLDDVGSSRSDLAAATECIIDDDNCRYLVTTISEQTAERITPAHCFHVEELDDDLAWRLLVRYSGGRLPLRGMDESVRSRLLRLGDGLPLGLMVLGLFLGDGLRKGGTLRGLLRKLDQADSLLRQDEASARLRPGRGKEASIDTILMARWQELPAEQQEALQTAAVFRGKPHAFAEAAWAALLEARRSASPELAETIGKEAANLPEPTELGDSWDDEPEIGDAGDADNELKHVTRACERLEGAREGLRQTGLIEQPQTGEPSFTIHSLIVTFLRTSTGLDSDGLKRLHAEGARYYRGWLAGFQDTQPASSPFRAASRLENRRWMSAMVDLCYHLREAGDEDQAVLLLATLFFDAFWWWGELVPYPLCDELLRLWQLTHLGARAAECLDQLRQFKAAYPVINLDDAPPADPLALPADYQAGERDDFQRVLDAVGVIRSRFTDDGKGGDAVAQRDLLRLRLLTGIYIGEAHRLMRQDKAAADSYNEALTLLEQLGEHTDADDWTIPYVYNELADLYVQAGNDEAALDACVKGARSAAGEHGEHLELALSESEIDHEVLGWLWRAAGDAHWNKQRLAAAWRSYAWACFHTCAQQLWPRRTVWYASDAGPQGIPERCEEFGADDYTVTCYKLQLARMLERIGELWAGPRRAEVRDGVRVIRATLRGGPDRARTGNLEADLDELAATHPDTPWERCRDLAWRATGLSGLALPLVPWERLTDRGRVEDQRLVASDLAGGLEEIWAAGKWTLDNGPGQV